MNLASLAGAGDVARTGTSESDLRCTNEACSLYALKLEANEIASLGGDEALCIGCLKVLVDWMAPRESIS